MLRAATQARCRNIQTPYCVGRPPILRKLKRTATPAATYCGTVMRILHLPLGRRRAACFRHSLGYVVAVAKLLILHIDSSLSPPVDTTRFRFSLLPPYAIASDSSNYQTKTPRKCPPVQRKCGKTHKETRASCYRGLISKNMYKRKHIASHSVRLASRFNFHIKKLES